MKFWVRVFMHSRIRFDALVTQEQAVEAQGKFETYLTEEYPFKGCIILDCLHAGSHLIIDVEDVIGLEVQSEEQYKRMEEEAAKQQAAQMFGMVPQEAMPQG